MAKYENLASINLELLDGNLAANPPITGPVALVIATAFSGKSNTQFLMNDVNKASGIFGANSALIKAANELKLGGAQNVMLYRIGGLPASLTGLFGDLSEITTVEETYTVGAKYSIYLGPQPNNPAEACLIIFEGTKIVYSNVPGSEVDLGRFVVVGFDEDFAYRIGTPSAPVALDDALEALVADTTYTTVGVTAQTDFDLPGTSSADTVITEVQVNNVVVTNYTLSIGTGGGGADEIVFAAAPANGVPIQVIFNRPATVVDAAYQAGADNIGCTQEKLYELIDSAFQDLETTIATHVVIPEAILDAENIADGSTETDRLTYLLRTDGDDGYVYTWSPVKTHYVTANQVTNATGDGATTAFALTGAADPATTIVSVTVAAVPTTAYTYDATTDILTFTAAPANADAIVITYKRKSTLSLATLNNNGQPIVDKSFREVNFAHRLGIFCDEMTANDRFIFGVIGTSKPIANTTAAVNAWIGTLPTTDAEGTITGNGTGLLGNRYMAGSTSQINGFYKTDSGYPDGEIQYDSNGAPIDLGKFLSVVSAVVVTPRSPILGLNVRSMNASSLYAGILTTVTAGNSTTNLTIDRVSLPFLIKKTKVNELAGAGYVACMEKGQGVVIASGELPTGPLSDYDYISTSITIADVTNRIRDRLDAFLGKGLNDVRIAAMQTIVDAEFVKSVNAGAIVKFGARVILDTVVNGKGRVKVPYTVVPAFELREVNQTLALAYDI